MYTHLILIRFEISFFLFWCFFSDLDNNVFELGRIRTRPMARTSWENYLQEHVFPKKKVSITHHSILFHYEFFVGGYYHSSHK